MKAIKAKYYALDDVHEIVSEKSSNNTPGNLDKLTKEFFRKRRGVVKKAPGKIKS